MKNLKKGLAVAMSLAMIATVMPTMKVNATAGDKICELPGAQTGATYIDSIKDIVDLDTVNVFDEAELGVAAKLDNLKEIVDCSGFVGAEYVTIAKKLIAVFGAETDNKVFEYENAVMDLIGLVGEAEDALEFALSTSAKQTAQTAKFTLTYALQTTEEDSDIKLAADGTVITAGKLVKGDGTAAGTYGNAVAVQTILENEFAGNITSSLQAVVEKYKSVLDDFITEYKEDNLDATVKAYVDAINAINTLTTNKTVEQLLDGTTEIPYSDASKVKAIIAAIKENKVTSPKALPSKYADMEDEPEVVEIMDALEETLDAMNDVAVFAKAYTKDDAFKNYDSKTKIEALNLKTAAEIAAAITDTTTALTTKEINAVKTFVEEMTNEYYEVEKTERTNGTYRVTVKPLENARFLGTAVSGKIKPAEIEALLTKLADKEEGTTYYDLLVEVTKNVDAAIKAITTGIKGVTTSNLSASNVNKVIAADKAFGELTGKTISSYYTGSGNGWDNVDFGGTGADDTGYTHNLTAAQTKTVKGQIATLKNLVAKMYALGLEDTELKTGWVDLGNGNWDFFNEDGTPATKWVAAGKLWYYVKGGHMLTNSWVAQDATGNVWYYVNGKGEMVVNTTVDGYTINANGEWHK